MYKLLDMVFLSYMSTLPRSPRTEAATEVYRAIFEDAADKPARFLYHRSNPAFRNQIKTEGLKPQVGESYSLYWDDHFPGQEKVPLIFLFDGSQLYDSTYDDDLVRVDTSLMNMEHLKPDPAFGGWCYTYDLPIPPSAIKFLYNGTGSDDGDGACQDMLI